MNCLARHYTAVYCRAAHRHAAVVTIVAAIGDILSFAVTSLPVGDGPTTPLLQVTIGFGASAYGGRHNGTLNRTALGHMMATHKNTLRTSHGALIGEYGIFVNFEDG